MFKRATESFLAIDLATECVRVLEVSLRRGEPCVQSLASEALTEANGESLPERQLAALEKAVGSHRMRTHQCVAAMPTSLVTTRSVIIDPAKPQTPDEQIKQTLQNILSFDARDLLFDYWKVTEPGEKSRTYEVLVVAAQRTVVHKYLDGFQRLHLSCTHMDVAPCALASLVARLKPQDAMTATVTLGQTQGYFALMEKERVLFWRPFDMPPAKNGPQWALERIGDEISKCVSHMIGSQHLDNLAEIVLFGNNASDPSFGKYMASRFNVQVETPSPMDAMGATSGMPEAVKTALQEPAARQYAVALGLAWQGAGGIDG